MSTVADDVVILLPQNNAIVDRNIIFEGTGASAAEIILTSGVHEVGRTVVSPDNIWRIEYGKLGNGDQPIVATQTDLQGTVSRHSINITVTTTPIGITWPYENSMTLSSFLVAGYCDPGAILEFFIDGKSLETMTPDARSFEIVLGPLADGQHRIGIQQRSINGEVTSTVVDVTSDANRPLTIRSPEQGESFQSVVAFEIEALPNGELTAIENGEIFEQGRTSHYGTWGFPYYLTSYGEKNVTINQLLDGVVESRTVTFQIIRVVEPISIFLPENDANVSPEASFFGAGDAGATITLTEGNRAFAKGQVDENEQWTITPDKALSLGKKDITATQVALDGTVSKMSINLEVVEKLPVTIRSPVDGETVATNFFLAGTGTVNASVKLTENNLLIGSATVDFWHGWGMSVTGLTVGTKKLVATQTYSDNSISQTSVQVDVIQVAPLVIDYPEQDSTITNLTPMLRGRGHPGSNLFTAREGIAVPVARVDEEGNWAGRLSDNWFSYGENLLVISQASGFDSPDASVRFFISQSSS